jgi:hypothetical protein
LELWIKPLPESSDSRLRPILTFGEAVAANTTTTTLLATPGLTKCDDQQMDFQLNQRGDSLEMIYRTSDSVFEPCRRFRLLDMPLRLAKIGTVRPSPISTTVFVSSKVPQIHSTGTGRLRTRHHTRSNKETLQLSRQQERKTVETSTTTTTTEPNVVPEYVAAPPARPT